MHYFVNHLTPIYYILPENGAKDCVTYHLGNLFWFLQIDDRNYKF